MNVGIVCGYGIVVDERLQRYVDAVIEYALAHQLDTLLLSGGATVDTSSVTEAAVMKGMIEQKNLSFHLLLEEHSLSTLHNMLFARAFLEQKKIPLDGVYIFCDSVRYMKVLCLSKLLFRDYETHVAQFARREPLVMYLLQIPFTLLQCAGAVCPPVAKCLLICRQYWRGIRKSSIFS